MLDRPEYYKLVRALRKGPQTWEQLLEAYGAKEETPEGQAMSDSLEAMDSLKWLLVKGGSEDFTIELSELGQSKTVGVTRERT